MRNHHLSMFPSSLYFPLCNPSSRLGHRGGGIWSKLRLSIEDNKRFLHHFKSKIYSVYILNQLTFLAIRSFSFFFSSSTDFKNLIGSSGSVSNWKTKLNLCKVKVEQITYLLNTLIGTSLISMQTVCWCLILVFLLGRIIPGPPVSPCRHQTEAREPPLTPIIAPCQPRPIWPVIRVHGERGAWCLH